MHEIHRSAQRSRVDLDMGFENPSQVSKPIRGSLPLHVALAMSLMGLALLVTASSYAGGSPAPQNGPGLSPAHNPGEEEILDPPASAPVTPPPAVPVQPRSRYAPKENAIRGREVPKPVPVVVTQKPKPAPAPNVPSDPCALDCSACDCSTSACGSGGGVNDQAPQPRLGDNSPFFNSGVTYWNGSPSFHNRTQIESQCSSLYGSGSGFKQCVENHLSRKRVHGLGGHLALRMDQTALQTQSWSGFSDTGRIGVEGGGRVDAKISSVVILQGEGRAYWVGGNRSYTTLPSGDQVLNNEQGAKGEIMVAVTGLSPESACGAYAGVLARLNLVNDASRDQFYATKDAGVEGGVQCHNSSGTVKFQIGLNGALSFGDQLYTQSDLEKKMGARFYLEFLDRLKVYGRTEYRYRSQVWNSESGVEYNSVGPGFYVRYNAEWQSAQQLDADTQVSAGPGTAEPISHVVHQFVIGVGF